MYIIVSEKRDSMRNIIVLAKGDYHDFILSNLIFDLKYFISIINVIALKFPSILCPVKKNPIAIGNKMMPTIGDEISKRCR